MNKLLNFLTLFLLVFVFSSCEEVFEEENRDGITQYFEGKVNGERFEGSTKDEQCNRLSFVYFNEAVSDLAPGYMEMGARDCLSDSELIFVFQGVEPEYTGSFSLTDLDFADSFRPAFTSVDGVTYNRLLDGSFSVDHFSGSNNKHVGRLSGSFEMKLVDVEKTDTLNITEGAFAFTVPRKFD
ncbi:MAG: hypothetical protein MK086_00385 [Flavobacteriales bacterium]|nr:hypothetical protein [Flavobacteriales bacterium]